MKYQETQAFDRAVQTVLAMFVDRRYFERKSARLGYREAQVLEFRQDARQSCLRLRYQATARLPLPDFARRFVPGLQAVTETHQWDLPSATGHLGIEIAGLPLRIGVDMRLQQTETGCENRLDWDIHCAVPLIGAKLENLLQAELQARSAADYAASLQLLAHYGAEVP